MGCRIEDFEKLDGTYFLTRMGPLKDPKNPSVQTVADAKSLHDVSVSELEAVVPADMSIESLRAGLSNRDNYTL